MQPLITTTITCLRCGGTLSGSENRFTVTCPYCATEYTVSIEATVVEPVDIKDRIGRLLACVLDGNPRERGEAVLELAKIKTPEMIPPVVETMKVLNSRMSLPGQMKELQPLYAALNNIVLKIGLPEAADPLIALLRDESGIFRQTAANALGNINSPAAVEPLMEAASDPDAWVRTGAARSLGAYSDPRIPGVLLAVLEDPSLRVREAAVRSLGTLKYGEAEGVISGILKTTRDDYNDNTSWSDVRKAAVWALSDIRSESAVKTLVDAAEDGDAMVRAAVIQELESIWYTVKDGKLKRRIGEITGRG